MHDYGLSGNERLKEFGCWKEVPYKKVVMCNVRLCKNRITVNKIAKHLREWKISDLEHAEAVWLTEAVVNAINANEPTVDISKMFNIQVAIYTGPECGGIIPREAIAKVLYEKLFQKIDENDEQINVKLNWWCLL